MHPLLKEAIGIVATLLIFVSMMFNASTPKGNMLMRVLNLIGCVVFTVYGILVPAISTAILNGALVVVNAYHLIKITKQNKKEKNNA